MKIFKNIAIIFFFLLFTISLTLNSWGAVIVENHWDNLTQSGWGYVGNKQIDNTTNTPDPTGTLRIDFPIGLDDGVEAGQAYYDTLPNKNDIYVGFWFKFSSNWDRHSIGDKLAYSINQNGGCGNFAIIVRNDFGSKMTMTNQPCSPFITANFLSNTGYDPVINLNTWYWVEYYAKKNTPGVADGLFKLWIDGQLVTSHTNVPYWTSSEGSKYWGIVRMIPVWGGNVGDKKTAADSIWYDDVIVSDTQIGYPGAPVPDTTPPAAPTGLAVQ